LTTDWQVRQAIADQLTKAFTASETDITVHVEPGTFSIAEMPAVDTLHMASTGLFRPDAAFGELRGPLPLNIRVRVSPADIYAGEELLSSFMDDVGDLSILVALDSDHSLGGVASDIAWGDWTQVMPFPSPTGDGELIGARLPLEVVKASS
jgi:hypothetical protein